MRYAAIISLLAILSGVLLNRDPAAPQGKEYVLFIEEKEEKQVTEQENVKLYADGEILKLPMETYLLGVLLTEMPPTFHPEALKAQAVAARTYAVSATENSKHDGFDLCADPGCCQAWRPETRLREEFGKQYAQYVQKGMSALEETAGEVLTYEGELIDAVYFSCSGGSSEAAVAVWGTDVPYLQAVESPGEEEAAPYCTQVCLSFAEFRRIVRQADANAVFSVIPQDWIGKTVHSSGGGVASVTLAGCEFTGTEVRRMFSLPSTKFEMTVGNGEIQFTVYGYGHRVGMSQYGAQAMAEKGADHRKILTHYYTGVSIKKLSR